jgi:hypothetical protein
MQVLMRTEQLLAQRTLMSGAEAGFWTYNFGGSPVPFEEVTKAAKLQQNLSSLRK